MGHPPDGQTGLRRRCLSHAPVDSAVIPLFSLPPEATVLWTQRLGMDMILKTERPGEMGRLQTRSTEDSLFLRRQMQPCASGKASAVPDKDGLHLGHPIKAGLGSIVAF